MLIALASAEVTEPGLGADSDSVDTLVPLRPGVSYRFTSQIMVSGMGVTAGTFAGNAFSTYQLHAVAGDHNGNGIVDAADYESWRATFGSTSMLEADGNRSGTVDAADYVVWRDALRQAGRAQSFAAAVAPESSSGMLAVIGLIAVCFRRARAKL
jgi:hypothetical protein